MKKTNKLTVKNLVKDRIVEFEYYYDGELWYSVKGTDFKFPVPIKDIGTATFYRTEKAVLSMRYIRKHIKLLEGSNE